MLSRRSEQSPDATKAGPIVSAVTAASALILVGCADDDAADPDINDAETTDNGENLNGEGPAESDDQDESFTIAGVGDVLTHDAIIDAAEDDGGYDFSPFLTGVQDWIAGADLALCGMEVPIAPEGTEPVGYPTFAAPEETVTALSDIGFHGCSTANNHSLDQGIAGLEHTLDTFDEHDLGHAGTARTEEEAETPQVFRLERGDTEVTVAHLANTMVHNEDIPPPADTPWAVTDVSAEELTERAAQAREAGADIVLASVHWGEEYTDDPTEEQRDYGEELAAGGEIDLVLGSHSHTPQPLEQLEGGPSGDGMWVAWSMGNFFTNQDEECCAPETATGAMVYATVEAGGGEDPSVTDLEWSPVTVDRQGASRADEDFYGVWPLAELMEDIPDDVASLDEATLQERWDRAIDVVGEDQLRQEAPEPTSQDPQVIPREE